MPRLIQGLLPGFVTILGLAALLVVPTIAARAVEVVVDAPELDAADAIVDDSIDPVLQETRRLQQVLEEMRRAGEPEVDVAARERELGAAEEELTERRIAVLSKDSGVSEAEIASMRAEGKGWGVIAKELGVHPGVLGVGHGKGPKGTPPGQAKVKAKGKAKGESKGKSKGKGGN